MRMRTAQCSAVCRCPAVGLGRTRSAVAVWRCSTPPPRLASRVAGASPAVNHRAPAMLQHRRLQASPTRRARHRASAQYVPPILSVHRRLARLAISVVQRLSCYKGYWGSGSPYSVGEMDWTADDTVKTTMNGISNITFIELRHACRTEVLKMATDGRVFSLPRPRSDRPDEAAPLALHHGD